MDGMVHMKRVKRKIKSSPNPLFESWLKEWQNEAKQNGSEMHYCFSRALKSLRKYPFRLESGKECFILENFGVKICMMLDKRLNEYRNAGEISISENVIKHSNCNQNVFLISDKSTTNYVEKEVQKSCSLLNEVENSCSSYADDQQEILRNELGQKRKSCTDSPVRTSKIIRDDSNHSKSNQNKKNGRCNYLPGYRSGGYAILLTLYRNRKQMTKAELEVEAQNHCDAPFKKSGNSHYTAWSSMATLVKKGLVEKSGRPARFSLTTEGLAVAAELKSPKVVNDVNNIDSFSELSASEQYPNFHISVSIHSSSKESLCIDERKKKTSVNNNPSINLSNGRSDIMTKESESLNQNNESRSTMVNVKDKDETFFLLPNEFDVILYVDNQEMENKKNVENDKTVKYLRRRNVKFELKHLNVGDYLWVCRDRKTKRELVLPYIVERKRIDDLAGSVKDGRFHEQKFRLKNSGIHHCIYLVEKYGNDSMRLGLPLPTIQQAVSNTKVVDGFFVKVTNNNEDSLAYLSLITEFLRKTFQAKTLVSCKKMDLPILNLSDELISLMSFLEFNKDSEKMKKFTVRNMLVKHLLQLSGVSVERAKAIVKHFPTPKLLMETLQRSDGESLVADIKCGALGRSVGSNLAKSLQQLYTLPRLK